MSSWTQEAQTSYYAEQGAREDGARLLSENAWAQEAFDLYLDVKDFAKGTRLSDLPPSLQEAFRAIRQGSGGRLGNPPVM